MNCESEARIRAGTGSAGNERKTELLAACKRGQTLTGRLKPERRKRRGLEERGNDEREESESAAAAAEPG